MLSTNSILKPSDGRPVAMPSQDMIIGLFHLTSSPDPSIPVRRTGDGSPCGPIFSSQAEAPDGVRRRQPGPEHRRRISTLTTHLRAGKPRGWEARRRG